MLFVLCFIHLFFFFFFFQAEDGIRDLTVTGVQTCALPICVNRSIIYQPWLEPAIDLFTRFRAFDFSIAHLCRYIESKPHIFPTPTEDDMKIGRASCRERV